MRRSVITLRRNSRNVVTPVQNLQWMVDGLTMEIGQSAPLNVEEEAKTGAETAPTLLQQTVALIVKDQALKVRNAT
jgi:hypothetical protein